MGLIKGAVYPRGLMTGMEKALRNKLSAEDITVLNKVRFAFIGSKRQKLQNVIDTKYNSFQYIWIRYT